VDWTSASALKLHAAMIGGVAGSLAAGGFEWTRARAGHEIAWVYTFEWPLFAVMGVYVWWRLLHPDTPARRGPRRPERAGRPERTRGARHVVDADDLGLQAWHDYLSRLHASDPPGGPPPVPGGRASG
jgi:hypothetical protein